jgi:hypothetical protein
MSFTPRTISQRASSLPRKREIKAVVKSIDIAGTTACI